MRINSDPNIGIVVIGYKNLKGIKRLLQSLDNLECGDDKVKLIISIDYSGDNSVETYANKYIWDKGEKIVIPYSTNLGLKQHILKCGDYIDEYDFDAIIVLEDDIYVSPSAYIYAKQAVSFYKDNDRVAGISLYKHEINLFAKHPFYEIQDGGDTFFIQYAMSWGQVWMKQQWKDFKKWYDDKCWESMSSDLVPKNVRNWNNSWLKFHIMYCIDQNKFFVYPRISLSTNFTDVGTHNMFSTTKMQVSIVNNIKTKWDFNHLEDTLAVYDAFFENVKLKKHLHLLDCEIDIYGVKTISSNTRYLLTRKELPYKMIRSWGLQFRPHEMNIFQECTGNDIFLYDLSFSASNKKIDNHDLRFFEYDLKGVNIFKIQIAKYFFNAVMQKIKYEYKKKK